MCELIIDRFYFSQLVIICKNFKEKFLCYLSNKMLKYVNIWLEWQTAQNSEYVALDINKTDFSHRESPCIERLIGWCYVGTVVVTRLSSEKFSFNRNNNISPSPPTDRNYWSARQRRWEKEGYQSPERLPWVTEISNIYIWPRSDLIITVENKYLHLTSNTRDERAGRDTDRASQMTGRALTTHHLGLLEDPRCLPALVWLVLAPGGGGGEGGEGWTEGKANVKLRSRREAVQERRRRWPTCVSTVGWLSVGRSPLSPGRCRSAAGRDQPGGRPQPGPATPRHALQPHVRDADDLPARHDVRGSRQWA